MSALSNAEFERQVMAIGATDEPFAPTATYDPDGDCIEFLASAEPFYAEGVDGLVTVYYSQETKEIIGSLIKGVSHFCKKLLSEMPGFQIEIIDGRVKLVQFFRAHVWASEHPSQDVRTITYRKLIQFAEESNADVEAPPLLREAA